MAIFNVFTSVFTVYALRTHARDARNLLPLPSPLRVNTHINASARGRVPQSRDQRHFVLQAEVRGRSRILKNTICFRYIAS